MSVITESQPGDRIVCLEEYFTSPYGQPFSWKTCRKIRIGESVRYVRFYLNEDMKDNPVCWMVVFQADDEKLYAGTQTYFVTEECWHGLERHFTQRLRNRKRKTARKKAPAKKV